MKDEAKVNKNKEKKQTIVAELTDKVGKAKAMVFTNYQGMTHLQLEGLKRELKKMDAELVVAKNTLLKRALVEGVRVKGKAESQETLTLDASRLTLGGPTATLFAYGDVVLPLKELTKLIKALKLPEIKAGLFEGKMMSDTEVVKLSTLPSKEVLLAQLVGTLKSPIYGLHRSLNWNIQKFVMTLSAIEKSKQA